MKREGRKRGQRKGSEGEGEREVEESGNERVGDQKTEGVIC